MCLSAESHLIYSAMIYVNWIFGGCIVAQLVSTVALEQGGFTSLLGLFCVETFSVYVCKFSFSTLVSFYSPKICILVQFVPLNWP